MTGKDLVGSVKVASTAKEPMFHDLPHLPDTMQQHREFELSSNIWQRTVEQCVKSIVSIKGIRHRCFDTDTPSNFAATGFVVDAKRGIVLTNRHVVSAAPTTAQAVLSNHEQIDLVPIYRDPVHDFGFFQYNTENVRFLDIPGIELYPEGARVGVEIRVIGNNDNEQLTILSGTLARLDRQAPNYGEGEYNDFNTFYMQAASGTASGSSGSPVLDIQGRAIALHAGGKDQRSSFYLPLLRVQRALQYIQTSQHVPRGTIQTEFVYKSYHELTQLGLPAEYEAKLRGNAGLQQQQQQKKHHHHHHGMLVVRKTLPDGPAHGLLEPGDILFGTKPKLIRDFDTLEDLLDSSVGQTAMLYVMRAGIITSVDIKVQDLHSITPNRYLEFGGGIVHDLSYQMAHSYGLSLHNAGVYVAAGGYLLGRARATRGSVIASLNYKQINNLDDFISIVQTIPEGCQVPIRYYRPPHSPRKAVTFIMKMERKWNPFLLVTRNDKTGLWDYKDLETSSIFEKVIKHPPMYKCPPALVGGMNFAADSVEDLKKALCSVECYPPIVIDGMRDSHTFGTGIVVSLDPPLVLCDRDTIPVGICSLALKFNNHLIVSGQLLFLHPFYNFAVVSFDINAVMEAQIDIRYATLAANDPLNLNDAVYYVALDGDDKPEVQETYIAKHIKGIRTRECLPPRYRACNMDAHKLSKPFNGQGGFLANQKGEMIAHWQTVMMGDTKFGTAREMFGIAIKYIQPVIDALRARKKPLVRGLDVELWTMQTANARLLGLPEEWLKDRKDGGVLYVISILNRLTPSGSMLQLNDIVLEMQGKAVTDVSCLTEFVETEQIDMTVFRNGEIIHLTVPTTVYDGQETTQVVGWQGLHLQQVYPAVREQIDHDAKSNVLASCCLFGSPAQEHVPPNVIITEINGQKIETLQDILTAVEQSKEKKQKYARVKYVTSRGQLDVCAFQLDYHYWPTWHVHKDIGLVRK